MKTEKKLIVQLRVETVVNVASFVIKVVQQVNQLDNQEATNDIFLRPPLTNEN